MLWQPFKYWIRFPQKMFLVQFPSLFPCVAGSRMLHLGSHLSVFLVSFPHCPQLQGPHLGPHCLVRVDCFAICMFIQPMSELLGHIEGTLCISGGGRNVRCGSSPLPSGCHSISYIIRCCLPAHSRPWCHLDLGFLALSPTPIWKFICLLGHH